MITSILCISAGASTGALLRWGLALLLNSLYQPLLLGTLAANLLGAYCTGIAISILNALPNIGEEWRLLVITGFLGGLTTFSAFTAEIGLLLQGQRIITALAAVFLHVCGSLAMLFLGFGTIFVFRHFLRQL